MAGDEAHINSRVQDATAALCCTLLFAWKYAREGMTDSRLLREGQTERASFFPLRASIGGVAFDDDAFSAHRTCFSHDAVIGREGGLVLCGH